MLHYGLALAWSPLPAMLRRATRLRPVTAGLGTGAAMSLIADERMTSAGGFAAPKGLSNGHPSARVHAHLAFGLAVAAVTESGWCLRGRRP